MAVQLTRPIDSGHRRIHASYPESHLLVHCSSDSCAIRSFNVSIPASLDVTPDSHTRQINAYLTSSSPISPPASSGSTKGPWQNDFYRTSGRLKKQHTQRQRNDWKVLCVLASASQSSWKAHAVPWHNGFRRARTSSRQLRRLFFRRPVPFSFLSSSRNRRAPEFSSRCRRCETDSRLRTNQTRRGSRKRPDPAR